MEIVARAVNEWLSGVEKLFLDTAPIIYHVEGNPRYQPVTDVIFRRLDEGFFVAVTSSITLAETLVLPYRLGNVALVEQFRNVIVHGANTHYVGVDGATELAAEIRARYDLSLIDSFQVATALNAGCDALLTNDADIRRIRELRVLVLDDLLSLISSR